MHGRAGAIEDGVLSAVIAVVAAVVAAAAPVVAIDGAVSDAFFAKPRTIVLTSADARGRRLVRVDAEGRRAAADSRVPADAIFVDACPDGRVVFAGPRGLEDVDGKVLVEGHALFTVPDADALLVADLCGQRGDGDGELRLPVVDGLLVVPRPPRGGEAAKAPRLVHMRHEARAYSGRAHRGLRPDRGYAEALSLYGPRLIDADVDADGDTDLIAVHEGEVVVWRRTAGDLEASPWLSGDLGRTVGAGDADLRVRIVDADADGRADAVIGVTRGAVPERSEAWLVSSTSARPFSSPRLLWRRDGLVAPIGERGRALVVAEVDTSLVSLSAVVVTGRIPVKVGLQGGEPLAMQAKADVRGGHMDGALPVVSVDFDGDGVPDLLDLGEPGRAALHKGTAAGFALDATATWEVPAFVHVVAMPALPGVVLVGEPHQGKTAVAIITTARSPHRGRAPRR